jgi:hypothetical protein
VWRQQGTGSAQRCYLCHNRCAHGRVQRGSLRLGPRRGLEAIKLPLCAATLVLLQQQPGAPLLLFCLARSAPPGWPTSRRKRACAAVAQNCMPRRLRCSSPLARAPCCYAAAAGSSVPYVCQQNELLSDLMHRTDRMPAWMQLCNMCKWTLHGNVPTGGACKRDEIECTDDKVRVSRHCHLRCQAKDSRCWLAQCGTRVQLCVPREQHELTETEALVQLVQQRLFDPVPCA